MSNAWRRCSSCKSPIAYEAIYWVCNVSTCNRKRTALAFCTTDCWDVHLGVVYHRKSWAIEERAPAEADTVEGRLSAPRAKRPPRRIVTSSPAAKAAGLEVEVLPRDALIVSSKLKAYIKASSGMSTSDRVQGVLSDEVRKLANRAIQNARRAGRKTVLDRDFGS